MERRIVNSAELAMEFEQRKSNLAKHVENVPKHIMLGLSKNRDYVQNQVPRNYEGCFTFLIWVSPESSDSAKTNKLRKSYQTVTFCAKKK